MPFDPDAYLAKKQVETADSSANAPAAFNPDAYLQSKGVQTLPDSGQVKDGATSANALDTYQKYAPVAGQGAALGFGKQLNAGLQSAMGAVDQTVNGSNNFGDQSAPNAGVITRALDAISNLGKNYSKAKVGIDSQIQKARDSAPITSALSEIASSIPATIATGSLIKAGNTLKAGIQGAAYSYGASPNEGLDRLKDAATGGAISAATAGAFEYAPKLIGAATKDLNPGKYLESEYGNYSAPIKAAQKMTAEETPYGLNYKTSLGDQFKLGKEMSISLTDPNVQKQISQELNNQPKIAQGLIDSTKGQIGALRDGLKDQFGDAEVDSNAFFKKAYDFIDNIKVGKSDAERAAAKVDLKDAVANLEDSISTGRDPFTNGLSKTTLGNVLDAQASFGKDIFDNKIFNKDSVINGAAKKVWGMLADHASAADEAVGSGGQVQTINSVFKSLYDMEDNMITGQTIKSLADPQAVGADNKYSEFVSSFEKLPANVRNTLAPDLHNYLASEFPKIFSKAKLMLLATGRGGENNAAAKQILSLAGLGALKDKIASSMANTAGVMSNNPMISGTAQGLGMLKSGVRGSLPAVAPALGAMTAPVAQRSALNQFK